jgi:thioredoxin-dependent peroxiredoxin
MNLERKGIVQFHGNDVTVVGADIQEGQMAPEFTAQTAEWEDMKVLESTNGKVRIIGSMLSVNTSVCDRETRRFNQEAAALGKDVAILMLTMDLPFTLKSWCAAAGIDQVITLSDHMIGDFGQKYGTFLKEFRFLRRAIFVIDRDGKVVYVAYMPVLGDEPDYGAVLAAVKKAL